MKRRKDSGFTLIELMIVIAVIGILAIVLVPKIGTVKTQAKASGLDTNIRLVQGYVESKIDKWISKDSSVTTIAADIDAAFTGANKALTNPFNSKTLAAVTGDPIAAASTPATDGYSLYIVDEGISGGSATAVGGTFAAGGFLDGSIVVVLENDVADAGPIEGAWIYAFDENGALISEKSVHVTP